MKTDTIDQELAAVKVIYEALAPLDDRGRQFVLKTVTERLGTSLPIASTPAKATDHHDRLLERSGDMISSTAPSTGGKTVKQFLKEKQPVTEVQRIACLAFHLTHSKNQPQFTTKDLRQMNTEAGETPFSNPSMAITNATRQSGYLAPVGRGKKQITTLGEDVVNALPDQAAVKDVVSSRRKRRKRSVKKAAPKS